MDAQELLYKPVPDLIELCIKEHEKFNQLLITCHRLDKIVHELEAEVEQLSRSNAAFIGHRTRRERIKSCKQF